MELPLTNQPLFHRFQEFFKTLSKNDKIAIYHDTDPDGITSAKIITACLNRLNLNVKLYLQSQKGEIDISNENIALIKKHHITKLITTDKAIECSPEQIKKVEQFANICIFDHHVIENDISSTKTVFLKPQLLFQTNRPDQYCSAKFTYDLLNTLTPLDDLDWICLAGVIGDMAFPAWPEFVHKTLKKYKLKNKDLFSTKIGLLTQLISFAESLDEQKKCLKIILSSNNLTQALSLMRPYMKVKLELDNYTQKFDKHAEKYNQNNLLILEVKSPYKIKSLISSKIAHKKYPHKTIITTQKIGQFMTISARRNDCKISMNILLKKSLGNLPGNAGGHIPASGASVSIKDYPEFKQNLIKNELEMRTEKKSKTAS
ncbi:DHH family phosphoesterase [Candidatus Woesearchaeota archaeon]|nr:DHH family phosphoesterase [Candidatus Woesearchaeota archaeon]